jgi:ankyrin repeat protein
MLSKDKKLMNAKVNQYPIIYLAVRSGHYEIVEYLLRAGCCLNFKDCMSTPMHCAAYYGHYSLIPLLLMYEMPIDIKNKYGNLPI